jgi:type VII secretion protein EccE
MPRVTVAQLVLVELALAAGAAGYAARQAWLPAGLAAGVVLLALAVVPVRRRWAYQVVLSYVAMRRRRRAVRGPGLQTLLGGYRVTTVPAGRQGSSFGAVTVGDTWTVPLEIALDRVLNDDHAVPVDQLVRLLRVEDVPLGSVRLITVLSPAAVASGAAAPPVPPPPRTAARYCLLTLDLATASAAVATRGGTQAAVAQILRRSALVAEQVLAANGLAVRRLDETAVTALFPVLFGPAEPGPGGSLPPTVEKWRAIRVAGTWSISYAVAAADEGVLDRLALVAPGLPASVVVTSLVLSPAPRGGVNLLILLRVTGPGSGPDPELGAELERRAREVDIVVQRLDGEHGALLRATTPVGLASAAVR